MESGFFVRGDQSAIFGSVYLTLSGEDYTFNIA